MKSGIESALNKETEQYKARILALEKILEERDKTLYLLFNKIQSQEIQNLSYDERLSWLQIQLSSSSEITFTNSTVISNHNSYNKIGITSTKERINAKLGNQLKLIRNNYKEQYNSYLFNKFKITEDISDKSKVKNDAINTTSNNQNLDNDVERVRKTAINVENQRKEIRKTLHQRYQNDQRKPNNQNQLECKVDDKSKWHKITKLIVEDSMISGIDQKLLSIKGRIVKVQSFPEATINDMYDYIKPLLKKAPANVILHVGTNDAPNSTSRAILDNMLSLKSFFGKTLP